MKKRIAAKLSFCNNPFVFLSGRLLYACKQTVQGTVSISEERRSREASALSEAPEVRLQREAELRLGGECPDQFGELCVTLPGRDAA